MEVDKIQFAMNISIFKQVHHVISVDRKEFNINQMKKKIP